MAKPAFVVMPKGSGRAEISLIAIQRQDADHGVLVELGGSSRVVIDLPKGHAWFGAGGEVKSPSPARDQSAIRLDSADRLDGCSCYEREGCNGRAQRLPCQDGFVRQNTSCVQR